MPTINNVSTASPAVPVLPHNAVAYTPPNDTDTFVDVQGVPVPVAVYVGGGGNITVLPFGAATAVTFTNFPSGSVLPIMVRRVNLTGLTATNLIVAY